MGKVVVMPKLGQCWQSWSCRNCCIEATCWLPYEALVEAINACLPQDKPSLSGPQGGWEWECFCGMFSAICLYRKSWVVLWKHSCVWLPQSDIFTTPCDLCLNGKAAVYQWPTHMEVHIRMVLTFWSLEFLCRSLWNWCGYLRQFTN